MFSYTSAQTTWYVDDDAPFDSGAGDPGVSDPLEDGSLAHPFDAIQEALDAALEGDEVLVLDGTYTGAGNTNIDFRGKGIALRSVFGAEYTVVDCQLAARGFFFHSGETSAAVLDGFSVQNGWAADNGGAIYCEMSSPTIAACVLTGCGAPAGGALYCVNDSSPTLAGCTITANVAGFEGGGVYCHDYSSPTLAECTIVGNRARNGGGIGCWSYSNPTLMDCTITGNTAEQRGGGLYCFFSSPSLTKCTIRFNAAQRGGGVSCEEYSAPTLMKCTLVGNTAAYGGGLHCWYLSSPTLANCAIGFNTATDGGGVYCSASEMLTNCTITENTAERRGGGVYCSSSPMLTSCMIANNNAGSEGGGVYVLPVGATLANCVVTGNFVGEAGGAIVCAGGTPSIRNCTIAENTAVWRGGGLYCAGNANPAVTNCILWGDAPQEVYLSSSAPSVTYCDVAGGWPELGNIHADPLFVDPDGPDDNPATWEDNDYRLMAASPCIDAGDPAVVAAGETDRDGHMRVWDGDADAVAVVDMGAYEYGAHVYGDLNCDGVSDLFDIDPFVIALTSASDVPPFAAYYVLWPSCNALLADIDGDGSVDLFDIDVFVGLLGG